MPSTNLLSGVEEIQDWSKVILLWIPKKDDRTYCDITGESV